MGSGIDSGMGSSMDLGMVLDSGMGMDSGVGMPLSHHLAGRVTPSSSKPGVGAMMSSRTSGRGATLSLRRRNAFLFPAVRKQSEDIIEAWGCNEDLLPAVRKWSDTISEVQRWHEHRDVGCPVDLWRELWSEASLSATGGSPGLMASLLATLLASGSYTEASASN